MHGIGFLQGLSVWGVRAIEVYAKSLGLGIDLTLKDYPKFVGLTVPIELATFNTKLSSVGTFLKITNPNL